MTTKGMRTISSQAIASKTRKIAAIGAIAAVAVILNRVVVVPAPYLPFLSYEVWEVPIVVAFLAFGFTVAFPAAIMNFLILLLFPGVILAGPLYNLIAILSMLLGIGFAQKLLRLRQSTAFSGKVVSSTLFGIAARVSIMTLVNASLLQLPPPLGFSAPASLVYGWLPLIALFNGTVSLYTIPLAYTVLKALSARVRLPNGLG